MKRTHTIIIGLFALVILYIVFIFSYLSNSNDVVGTSEEQYKYDLFIGFLSHEKYKDKRDALRETCLKDIKSLNGRVGYAFFLGIPSSPEVSAKLHEEANEHNDIVFLDVGDTYANLSTKIIQMFSYASKNIKFDLLLKTDDDSYVNVIDLHKYLKPYPHKLFYMGRMWHETPYITNPQNKWYDPYVINNEPWKDCKYYPDYASGAGYVLSSDLVKWVDYSKDMLRMLHNEDATVGIWMTMLQVEKRNNKHFYPHNDACRDYFLLQHWVQPQEMRDYYRRWQTSKSFCDRNKNRN